MSNLQAKRDDNWQPVMMGETDDASRETSPLVVDPVTKRLKTTTTVTESSLPTGASTSAKQDSQITLETTLNTLVETLQELIQRLAPLAGAMANTAQLRTVVTGAVTATGGGYVTSAQVIAALLTQTNSFITSQRLESNNNLPVQSNINNVVIT